jgi:hypothetical protein
MPLIVFALAACAVVNVVRHRPALGIADVLWRAPWIVAACIVAQVVSTVAGGGVRVAAVVVSHALITGWLIYQVTAVGRLNGAVTRHGLVVLAFGALLNLIPIVAHGSMPVSDRALQSIGVEPSVDVSAGNWGKHIRVVGSDATTWLGDVIPIRPLRLVVSAGDLFMIAGIAVVSLASRPNLAKRKGEMARTMVSDVGPPGDDDEGFGLLGVAAKGDISIAHGVGR